jgi:hypothetical protein
MAAEKLIISPKTKVGELLDSYPQLERVLLDLSPAFAKLKNPLLRKTVARIATLQQAAVAGRLKTDDLVNRLRREAGQNELAGETDEDMYLLTTAPDWFDASKITIHFDATPVINAGRSPLQEILAKAKNLEAGEIMEVTTPFVPAPVIDMLRERGFLVFSIQKENGVASYFVNSLAVL